MLLSTYNCPNFRNLRGRKHSGRGTVAQTAYKKFFKSFAELSRKRPYPPYPPRPPRPGESEAEIEEWVEAAVYEEGGGDNQED